MPNIKIWLCAFRLRTLPLALASIILGGFLAAADGSFSWKVAILSVFTAMLLQVLSNLANDYGDFRHGADGGNRTGPKRATQSGAISPKAMKFAVLVLALLCLVTGFMLIRSETWVYYILGLAAVGAAIAYTAGPKPYGYAGLGDLFVLLFFGFAGVLGSYYLHTHELRWDILLPSASCGLFSVGVLNINNIRDRLSDEAAGKITIPVRLGDARARLYHFVLLNGALLCAVLFVLRRFESYWQLLFLLMLPLVARNAVIVKRKPAPELDPYLKQMALITLLFSITFGLGIIF
jgi:1,4-dihydroxy-2-naphthoate octaprenyltransferase